MCVSAHRVEHEADMMISTGILKVVTIVVFVNVMAISARNLRCWTCVNARSYGECMERGYFEQCTKKQVCMTEHSTRRDWLTEVYMTTGCRDAKCTAETVQNDKPIWRPTECSADTADTVCRCCCDTNECNTDIHNLSCHGAGPKERKIQVKKIGVPEKECKCIAKKDILIIVDSSSSIPSQQWQETMEFVASLIGQFKVSENAAQFAVVRFNNKVDMESEIYWNSFHGDRKGLQIAVMGLPKMGKGTNPGGALRHALDNVIEAGRGGDTEIEIVVVTDARVRHNKAHVKILENVLPILRETGIPVYYLGVGVEGMKGEYSRTELEKLKSKTGDKASLVLLNEADVVQFSDIICMTKK